MPSRRSLAELTLEWCASEVLPEAAAYAPRVEREVLRKASRDASRAAGVALLQAAAAEFNARDILSLEAIAAVIEDDDSVARLEERLTTQPGSTRTLKERAHFVGTQFKEWMVERLGDDVPPKMQSWLQRGWPDPRTRGGVVTFYQAFCGALQRAVRQDQATWDELMKNSGIEAATWRQWLIREADTGIQTSSRSTGKKAVKVFAIVAIIAAIVGAGAWYWWKEIETRLRALRELDQTPAATMEAPPVSPPPREAYSTTPSTPEPKSAEQILPKDEKPSPEPSSTTAAKTSEEQPRVNVRPDPLVQAGRLMDEAERTLSSDKPETGDRLARSAQDILSVRLPSHDVKLAESLSRVAQYWERRNDWAEAARAYQGAVKAYEKTPAENANPQLQAVSHWASALRHAGRNTEAERLYRMLLQAYEGMGPELRPEMATVAHNLGNVQFATGKLREARESYAQALKLMANRQSDPAAEPMITHFKASYVECLRKLGISESQIETDLRQTFGTKPPGKPLQFR